jgi:hypothetical protein
LGVYDEQASGGIVRALVLASLQRGFDPAVAAAGYSPTAPTPPQGTRPRKGDAEAALNAAGKFVEHALRAVEHVRTGIVPSEIKSVSTIIKTIEADGKLPESLRVLVPRFDVRSKRGAVHVKGINPRYIDAALAAQAASWILAEFVRLYHAADEAAVAAAMAALMAGNIPLIEKFDDDLVVTTPLHPETEVLLMVAASEPDGIDRKGLGLSVKHSAVAITRAVQKLETARHIHKIKSGAFRITGPGEQLLVTRLATATGASLPPVRRSG